MLEPKPKPKTKASAVIRRRGPPRVLLGYENGKALYVNATCDAVHTALEKGNFRHTELKTAFAAENAELKAISRIQSRRCALKSSSKSRIS